MSFTNSPTASSWSSSPRSAHSQCSSFSRGSSYQQQHNRSPPCEVSDDIGAIEVGLPGAAPISPVPRTSTTTPPSMLRVKVQQRANHNNHLHRASDVSQESMMTFSQHSGTTTTTTTTPTSSLMSSADAHRVSPQPRDYNNNNNNISPSSLISKRVELRSVPSLSVLVNSPANHNNNSSNNHGSIQIDIENDDGDDADENGDAEEMKLAVVVPPVPPPAVAVIAPPQKRSSFFERFKDTFLGALATTSTLRRRSKNSDDNAHHSERWDRMNAVLGAAAKKGFHDLPPDSVFGRYWCVVVALCSAFSFVHFTSTLMYDNTFSHWFEFCILFLVSGVNVIDLCLYGRKILSAQDRPRALVMVDILAAVPVSTLLWFVDFDYSTRCVLAAIPSVKLIGAPFLFNRSTPDAVDVDYVHFYYMWLPRTQFFFWFLLFLHLLTTLRVLSLKYSPDGCVDEKYVDALRWVWIMLTSAPFSAADGASVFERILSGLLMTASMILQGYVVGAMSMLVFSYNVKDENRTQMIVTLEMLRHYNLPLEVQHEVLSFQFHILEDSLQQDSRSAALERLPPSMLLEIQLYVKVDLVNRAKFFDGASQECKLRMASMMQQQIIDPESDIIVAGDIGEAMYFMFHGMADVILPNGLTVATIRRGDFFGEIALLSADCKRKATVRSLTYCDILALVREDFDEVLQDFPEFLDKIVERRADVLNQNQPPPPPPPPPPPAGSTISEQDVAMFAPTPAPDELHSVSSSYAPVAEEEDAAAAAAKHKQSADTHSLKMSALRLVKDRNNNNNNRQQPPSGALLANSRQPSACDSLRSDRTHNTHSTCSRSGRSAGRPSATTTTTSPQPQQQQQQPTATIRTRGNKPTVSGDRLSRLEGIANAIIQRVNIVIDAQNDLARTVHLTQQQQQQQHFYNNNNNLSSAATTAIATGHQTPTDPLWRANYNHATHHHRLQQRKRSSLSSGGMNRQVQRDIGGGLTHHHISGTEDYDVPPPARHVHTHVPLDNSRRDLLLQDDEDEDEDGGDVL
eukprot:PhM_4_TR10569/c0_g1_i2/m.15563